MRTLEAIRGRKFSAEVKTIAIDRSDLPARLEQQMARGIPYPLKDWAAMLRALQLVDVPQDQIVPKLIALYQEQVLAYYDPHDRTYYSIKQLPAAMKELGEASALMEEGVVVHELMHAMQDQHFGIGKKVDALKIDTDGSMAYHSVIEGEAVLVMLAHFMNMGGASLDDVIRNETALAAMMTAVSSQDIEAGAETPKYFVESMKFPYLKGLAFVIEAYKRGGWKAIDAIHADPPRSTREVMHPAEYFDKTFRAAKFDGAPLLKAERILTTERLGEFHWAHLAGAENARGLVNDRVTIALDANAKPTVLAETKWESPARATAFADAYEKFLAGRKVKAKVRRSGAVVKVAYGPDAALVERFIP